MIHICELCEVTQASKMLDDGTEVCVLCYSSEKNQEEYEDYSDYKVNWSANGMDFNYNGTEKVWASSGKDAQERAISAVSRKMCLSRHLISIEKVEVI